MKLFFNENMVMKQLSNFLFYKKNKDLKYNKILIFDFHLIGDIVMLTAFLEVLRREKPESKIILVAGSWAKLILANTKYVDEIIEYSPLWVKKIRKIEFIRSTVYLIRKLRREKFDIGIEIRGDIRQLFLMWLCNPSNICGYSFTGGKNIITIPIDDDGQIKHLLIHHKQIAETVLNTKIKDEDFIPKILLSTEQLLEKERIKKGYSKLTIGIHPFASNEIRQLEFHKINSLIKKLNKEFNLVIFFGPDDIKYEKELLNGIEMDKVEIFKDNLQKFILKVSTLDVYIGMDSGGAHIAASLDIPTVAIFGPANDYYSKPIGRNIVKTISISDNLVKCRPCNQKQCVNSIYKYCLKEIKVEMIVDEVKKLILDL